MLKQKAETESKKLKRKKLKYVNPETVPITSSWYCIQTSKR